MKKLLLILLLIPALLNAQSKEEKKAQEKAKKEAISNFKKILRTYRNWYWNGSIYEDKIEGEYSIDLLTGNYFYLDLSFIFEESLKDELAMLLTFRIPSAWLANYEGTENGEKMLKIQARFEGGPQFETVLYSENHPNIWLFKPEKIIAANGESISPIEDIFSHNKLFIKFQTNQFSPQKGIYKTVEFDLSGAKELYKSAKAIFMN